MALRDLFRPVDMNPARPSIHSLEPVVAPTIPGTNLLYSASHAQSRALGVAAVFRARQMNADTIASLPLRTGAGSLVPAPNRDQTVQEFTVETILSLEDYGDAYWHVTRGGNMTVLPFDEVTAVWNLDRTRRLYQYKQRKMRTTGPNPPLVVLAINRGRGDITGFGPMQSARIRGLIAEQDYSQEYFENSGNPSGVLTVPGELAAEEARELADQWEAARSVRSPAVVGGGLQWESTSFNPSDSEWVDTHRAGVGDAATLFGIPGALLNFAQAGSSLTYENIGDVYQGYWRTTLQQTYARRITNAWSEIVGTSVAFDPEELFLASMYQRALAAGELVGVGYDPAGTLDTVGLPPIRHTGGVPVTIQKEDT